MSDEFNFFPCFVDFDHNEVIQDELLFPTKGLSSQSIWNSEISAKDICGASPPIDSLLSVKSLFEFSVTVDQQTILGNIGATTFFAPTVLTPVAALAVATRRITPNDKSALDVDYSEFQLSMPKNAFDRYLKTAKLSTIFTKGLKAARRRRLNRMYARRARERRALIASALEAELAAANLNIVNVRAAQVRTLSRTQSLWRESAYLDSLSAY